MAIKDLLDKVGRTIAYHPALSSIVGGVEANILLTQLHYWSDKVTDGWIYKTQEEISQETGMSINSQRTARKALKQLGLIEEETAYKGVRFRVIPETLLGLWGNKDNLIPLEDKRKNNRPSLKCIEGRRNKTTSGIEKIDPIELKKSIPLQSSPIEKIDPIELKKSIPQAELDRNNQSHSLYREFKEDSYLDGEGEGENNFSVSNRLITQPEAPPIPESPKQESPTVKIDLSCWSNLPAAANFDFTELLKCQTIAEKDAYWWQNFDKIDDYLDACMARPASAIGGKFFSIGTDPWMAGRNVRSDVVAWYVEYRKRNKSKSQEVIPNRANCAGEFQNNYQRGKNLYWDFLNETVRPKVEMAIAEQQAKEQALKVPDFRNPTIFGVLEHEYLLKDMVDVGVTQFLGENSWHQDWLDYVMQRYPRLVSQRTRELVEEVIGKPQEVAA